MKLRVLEKYKYDLLRLIDSSIDHFYRSDFYGAIKNANAAEIIFQKIEHEDFFVRLRDARNSKKYMKYIDMLHASNNKSSKATLKNESYIIIDFEIGNFLEHYNSSTPLMTRFLREARETL